MFRSLLLTACGLTASSLFAATIDITFDTAGLVGHSAGPFALDFQLNDGSGTSDGNNSAVLTNFTFGGGSPLGSAILTGGASGDLSSTITIVDNAFLNGINQQFAPGASLSFRLQFTTNVDAGGIPDQFSWAITDATGAQLPTTAAGFDVFLLIDIDSSRPAIQTFGSDATRAPVAGGPPLSLAAPAHVEIVGIPEPAAGVLLLSGLASLFGLRRTCRQ